MTIIIGIDPGSRFTGYGIIKWEGNQSHYVDSGCLSLSTAPVSERLQNIFLKLKTMMELHQPKEAAIEQVFMHQNPNSALKLGQARGAAIVAFGGITMAEYSARQIKQAVVGYGAADKNQVQHMVKRLLNISQTLKADEADALAIALCHAHTRFSKVALQGKRASWRDYRPDKEAVEK
ncbi:MAG: Crossover junction endodeoxyribonuclease ruvC [uncultured bacterium]|nr:MAG: Crossover junction endodeoxyribonuclease ruvC [uncultured bacterium]